MMGLLSGYLVQLFADAGLADRDAAWSDNDVLGEWLERQQVKADDVQPLLTRFLAFLIYIWKEMRVCRRRLFSVQTGQCINCRAMGAMSVCVRRIQQSVTPLRRCMEMHRFF